MKKTTKRRGLFAIDGKACVTCELPSVGSHTFFTPTFSAQKKTWSVRSMCGKLRSGRPRNPLLQRADERRRAGGSLAKPASSGTANWERSPVFAAQHVRQAKERRRTESGLLRSALHGLHIMAFTDKRIDHRSGSTWKTPSQKVTELARLHPGEAMPKRHAGHVASQPGQQTSSWSLAFAPQVRAIRTGGAAFDAGDVGPSWRSVGGGGDA